MRDIRDARAAAVTSVMSSLLPTHLMMMMVMTIIMVIDYDGDVDN